MTQPGFDRVSFFCCLLLHKYYVAISAVQGEKPVAVLTLSTQLTPSERKALQKAVTARNLEKPGQKEGSHGEIVNERDRIVFEVGFA